MANPMFPWALQPLSECDPDVLGLIEKEKNRQWRGLELIASEVLPNPFSKRLSLTCPKGQGPLVVVGWVGWAPAGDPSYPPQISSLSCTVCGRALACGFRSAAMWLECLPGGDQKSDISL